MTGKHDGTIKVNKNQDADSYHIGYEKNGKSMIDLNIQSGTDRNFTDSVSEIIRFLNGINKEGFSFEIEHDLLPDSNVPVLNLKPDLPGKMPLVFFLHGFETSKEKALRYGIHFAANGYYTVLMDLPDHGERAASGFDEKYLTGDDPRMMKFNRLMLIKKAVEEIRMMVDRYSALSEIDSYRIGMAGISMGGTITLLESYDDARIRSIAPFLSIFGFGGLEGIDKRTAGMIRSLDPLFVYSRMPKASVLLQFGEKDTITEKPELYEFEKKLKSLFSDDPGRFSFVKHRDIGHDVSADMIQNAVNWFDRFLK